MNTGTIAKRYARALLLLVNESGNGLRVYEQALALLEHSDSVRMPLEDELAKLVLLLRRKGRMPYAKYILRSFVDQYGDAHGIVRARLTTAVPSSELEKRLSELIGSPEGSRMIFTTEVNPDLIGGFVLEVDDKLLDASARTQLDKIRRRLDEMNKRIV